MKEDADAFILAPRSMRACCFCRFGRGILSLGDDRSSVDPALRQKVPRDLCVLIHHRHDDQHRRLAREHSAEPRVGRHALALGSVHHRAGSDDEQAAQRPLALARGTAEALFAAAR